MKIAVINLARSTDRRELMEANLARLGLAFEFFTGIDAQCGGHLGVSLYSEAAALRDLCRPMSVGEIGCFASHYLLWRRCLESREPFVILEDDSVLDDSFVRTLEIASELLPKFPLVRLGLTWEAEGSEVALSLPDGFELVSLAQGTYGTQCYMLSDIAAEALVDHAAVWSLPLDIYVDRPEIHGLASYGLRPYAVTQADQSVYASVIGDERYYLWPHDPGAKIRWQVEKFLAARGRRLK